MKGYSVGCKRIRRLMGLMNLEALCPKRNLSKAGRAKYIMPYLLRHKTTEHSNQVWSIDITYIRMNKGFMYQIGILDAYSRYVVGWKLTNSLDRSNVLEVLKQAVSRYGAPEIINSDQGAQFTCHEWIDTVKSLGIKVSMDGRGRCLDNHWIERFWRSLKTEYVYICPQDRVEDLREGIQRYIDYYNNERPHQGINNCRPRDWYEYAA
ncbi:MAG: IS3 family transposase, partial [Bacteroidales bacterium]|nr:IS3 family transposase [Bacteroidales bacterium]